MDDDDFAVDASAGLEISGGLDASEGFEASAGCEVSADREAPAFTVLSDDAAALSFDAVTSGTCVAGGEEGLASFCADWAFGAAGETTTGPLEEACVAAM